MRLYAPSPFPSVLLHVILIPNALLFLIRIFWENCEILSHVIAYSLCACVTNYSVFFRFVNIAGVVFIVFIFLTT